MSRFDRQDSPTSAVSDESEINANELVKKFNETDPRVYMDTSKPDSYHAHEVIDRLHIANCMLDQMFTDHPFVEAHPEVKALIDEAGTKLAEAYQKASEVDEQSDNRPEYTLARIKAINTYLEESGPYADLQVIKAEVGETILRAEGKYI